MKTKLKYVSNNNPFDQNRISGKLNLHNGNGTLKVELSNVQYDDSGVFEMDLIIDKIQDVQQVANITLDIEG